jgi:hypothetical protein
MLLLWAATMVVSAGFEGGSIGQVELLAPTHLRCALKGQSDQNHRNRQASWYYFRLDNVPLQEIRIDFTGLVGEYNFQPGTHAVSGNTRPLFSYDDRTWTHFTGEQVSWDERAMCLTVRFTPSRSTVWIAHMVPYTERELDRLLAIRHPHLERGVAGRTVHGRDIPLLTITDPSVAESRKKVIWLMARQHAWETGTSWVADSSVRFLLTNDGDAARIRRSTIFKVIPVFDMDGVADGAVRFNANGYDNNRNWDTADPKLMPEISSVRKTMLDWLDAGHPIDLFLAMHNDESNDYVDGPAVDPRLKPLAGDLVARLRGSTSFYDPRSPRDSMSAPIDKGRYAVNQFLYKERKLPAFLMEMMVERHPSLARPRTIEDYLAFGPGLVKSLAGAAQQ